MYEDEDLVITRNRIPKLFFTAIYAVILAWTVFTGLYLGFYTAFQHGSFSCIAILPAVLMIYNVVMVLLDKDFKNWALCFGDKKENRVVYFTLVATAISLQAIYYENFKNLANNAAYIAAGNYSLANLYILQIFAQLILAMLPATYLKAKNNEKFYMIQFYAYLFIMTILQLLTVLTVDGFIFAPKSGGDLRGGVYIIMAAQIVMLAASLLTTLGPREKTIKITNTLNIFCLTAILFLSNFH
jgi:hypothetical protein